MTRYQPQWLQAGTYLASQDRRLISAIWPTPAVSGCAVSVASNMNLNVNPGQVVVPTANNTGSVLCSSDAVEVVTLATAPASGTNRIDLVCCSVLSTDIGTAAGDTFSFVAVTGSSGTVAPAVPAGMTVLAQVLVLGGSATLQAGNITDRRNPMGAVHCDPLCARFVPGGSFCARSSGPTNAGCRADPWGMLQWSVIPGSIHPVR